MTHNDIYYDDRDGNEPITSMWIEDKRLLCRKLDARQHWKDLACHKELRLTQDDVLLLAQSASRDSPTEGLLNVMSEMRATMLDLYRYLKQADLLAAMSIVEKYVPKEYHGITESESLDQHLGNPPNLTPAPPPPLSTTSNNPTPMRLMAPQDMLQAGFTSGVGGMSPEDSFMSLQADLDSTQIRAAHTIMATRNFDIQDIVRATDNFSDEHLISKGDYSSIYNVTLENTAFAAKVYNLDYTSVLSDLQEARHHNHENIVSITGKCLNGVHVILLYEYMTNGSLRSQLDSKGILSMDRRATILRGAARAVQYLHSNKPPLLHRNIKSTNILLDDGLKAKLSDFGLAVHVNKTDSVPTGDNRSQCYSHFSTKEDTSVIQRSKGYCAREVLSGRFTVKSDTYAFGVVILEACTGLAAFDSSRPVADHELVNYIENSVSDFQDMWNLADKSIRWEQKTYIKLFRLAQLCTMDRAKCRPTMNQVYKDMDEICAGMHTDIFGSDDECTTEIEPMSTLPPMESEYHSNNAAMSASAGVYYHPAMSLPADGCHYVNIPAGQSLQGYQYQYFSQPNPHRVAVESQSLHPGLVETQISTGNSSLGLSSLSDHVQSMPDGGEDNPQSSNLTSDPRVLHRQSAGTDREDRSYQEHSELFTADFSDVGESLTSADDSIVNAPGDLLQYLQVEAVRRTQQLEEEDAEREEEGAELDPELLGELENLDLRSSG